MSGSASVGFPPEAALAALTGTRSWSPLEPPVRGSIVCTNRSGMAGAEGVAGCSASVLERLDAIVAGAKLPASTPAAVDQWFGSESPARALGCRERSRASIGIPILSPGWAAAVGGDGCTVAVPCNWKLPPGGEYCPPFDGTIAPGVVEGAAAPPCGGTGRSGLPAGGVPPKSVPGGATVVRANGSSGANEAVPLQPATSVLAMTNAIARLIRQTPFHPVHSVGVRSITFSQSVSRPDFHRR